MDKLFHRLIALGGVVLLVLSSMVSFEAKADSVCEAYRPLHSTYQLTGYHATSLCSCANCHLGGVWKGTPTTCNGCHNGARSNAKGLTVGHIPVAGIQCSSCHTTVVFSGARMVHNAVNSPPGGCATCHNGSYTSQGAQGKPRDHIATTLSCDACHSTSNWDGARFGHVGVAVGTCATCHNGTTAMGMSTGHIPTGGASCDRCHAGYTSFANGTYTHTGSETCLNCHDGIHQGTSGKPATHPTTPSNCESCHSITGWPCHTGNAEILRKRIIAMLRT